MSLTVLAYAMFYLGWRYSASDFGSRVAFWAHTISGIVMSILCFVLDLVALEAWVQAL